MIDDRWVDRNDGVLVNRLFFSPLRRHHLNAKFVCSASNTNESLPQTASAYLNLNREFIMLINIVSSKCDQIDFSHSYIVLQERESRIETLCNK